LHNSARHTWEQIQQKKQSFCTIYNLRLDEIIVKYAGDMNTLVPLAITRWTDP
jgi:hypothetical protein